MRHRRTSWIRPLHSSIVSVPAVWLVAILPVLGTPDPARAAPCSGSQLQGSVFHDFDASGTRSVGNLETGVAGAVVTAFSNDGTSASCETLAGGGFGIDPPAGGFPVRVEVTLPVGWPYDALEPGASGLSTVFFAAAPATGLDVGVNVPGDYCQANPDVVATCFLQGDPLVAGSDAADGDTIVSVDYDRTVAPPNELAFGREVGAVWGLAYQRSSESLFAAAVLRRHAGTGPLGLGGLYRIDFSSGTPVAGPFVDLGTLGVPVGTDPRTLPGEDPPGNGPTGNEPGLDNLAYEEVGKVGLGDLDLDEETGTLWVTSLADGNLYSMVIGAAGNVPTSATRHDLPPVSCTDGVFRPWAVKSYRGRIFVGGVCSNENISPYPPEGGFIDFPNLEARVYSLDLVSNVFALELTIPLNYPKGCSGGTTGCQWYPWTDLSTASRVGTPSLPSHPTPILSDIEFADDGDMILGLTDRTGFQYGVQSPSPNSNPSDTTVVTVFAGGDMLRADFDPATAAFTLEANGIVGGVVGAGSGNAQGPGGGEYYSASTSNFHFELSQGGYAVLRGSNEFLGSAMDPLALDSGGLLWMHELGATPGARSAGYTLYQQLGPPTFAKGAGIGDVELRCEAAPLEIGNRVWCDAPTAGQDGDGIQGPGAPDMPLAGVTVQLSCDGGAVTASATTQADGTYLFNVSNVAGGLPFGADCTISIDSSQAALGACNLPTVANAGGADAGADLRDSDGLDPDADGIVEVNVTLGGPGENDHSIDFGFSVLQNIGSIGDTVWCDGFEGAGNGSFDAGEGVTGVTVTLFEDLGCNGTADAPSLGTQQTTGDGQYLFTGLAVGPVGNPVCYVVRVDASDADLGSCNEPITPLEYQPDLDVDNPSNLDNDFGFEEPLGDVGVIGDTVWCDGFEGTGNGTFDPGEGVFGVTVSLFEDAGCNGTADSPLGTRQTTGAGEYLFTDLPIGPPGDPVCYVVRVDASDADLGSCNQPITPLEYQPDLDLDEPEDLGNDFGFEEPLGDVGVIGDTVWCDGFEGTGNGTFDPGEGVFGVTVSLFEDAGCNGTADSPLGTRQTTGAGEYLFTGLPIGPPGDPVCYVVRVDASDADLGSCNLPITPLEYQPDLDLDESEDLGNDFGFEEPLEDIGVIGDTVWCDGLMGFGNGTFDVGEGVAGTTVSLFDDADCNDVADGSAIDTRETTGDGQYLFTGLAIGPPGDPVCYVVRVDASDADLGSCNQPITPLDYRPDLDLDEPEDLDNDFGFEEPCVDGDGDGICNESCVEDRDGDGEPDCSDFDPQGYLYCEDTGEILTGGSVEVVGPGAVDLIEDGSGGRYTFLTDGTPGEYTLMVNAPENLPTSDRCLDQGALDPSGNSDPLVLGAGQDLETPFLTDNRCSANPFYLTFELEPGDPFVINNNLPFGSCGPPPTEIPTLSGWGIFSLVLLLGGLGLQALKRLKRREPDA